MSLLRSLPAANAEEPAASQFDWSMLTWGLVGGLVVVFLTLTVVALVARSAIAAALRKPSQVRELRELLSQKLPAGAKWTVADSWATNLTALITATAALVAIFQEDLTNVFEHQAPLAFSVTTSAMLIIAALAPVVYTIFQPEPELAGAAKPDAAEEESAEATQSDNRESSELQGTMLGWCLAAAVTLSAVGGSLVASMRLVGDVHNGDEHRVAQTAAWLLIASVIACVMAYVVRSFFVLLRVSSPDSGLSLNSLVGFVTVSCCADPQVPTRQRISLL